MHTELTMVPRAKDIIKKHLKQVYLKKYRIGVNAQIIVINVNLTYRGQRKNAVSVSISYLTHSNRLMNVTQKQFSYRTVY